jgi:hypothetical protein
MGLFYSAQAIITHKGMANITVIEINWVHEILLLLFSLFSYLSLHQGHVASHVYSVSSFMT